MSRPVDPPASRAGSLWRASDVLGAVVWNVVAGTALIACSLVANRRSAVGDQVAWINLSVLALVVAAVGNGLLLLAARTALRRRYAALDRRTLPFEDR